MNDETKFRIKANTWLLPEVVGSPCNVIEINIGDLLMVAGRLCLVMKFSKHKEKKRKRVLVKWIDEEQTYWINCNTFLSLVQRVKDTDTNNNSEVIK